MNSRLCQETIEALEPYARRLLEAAEKEGESYQRRWSLAIQQAMLVCRAYDAEEEQNGLQS
jgi:hypothetical protein